MIRLARYVKPYLAAVLGAIALLFLQANAELALPDYMSRIVNVGIQQGGVENAVPVALRATTFERALDAAPDETAARLRRAYRRVAPGSAEAAELLNEYPVLTDEPIYLRSDVSPQEIDALNAAFARALLVAGSAEARTLVDSLEPAARDAMAREAGDRLDALGEQGVVQAAIAVIQAEYEALGADLAGVQRSYILRTGALMLVLSLLAAVATISVGYISARVAAGVSRDLRLAVFSRVEHFSSAEFDSFSTASLITRSTNDVMQIQMLVVTLIRMMFYAPIIGVGGIIRAVGKNSSMWWVIAAAVGALSVLVIVVYTVAVPKFRLMQKLVDRLNLVSREILAGMMVVRAFTMQRHEEQRFDGANTELTETTLFVNRIMVIMMPLMMLIMNALSLLIIWVGAQQVAASAMQVGDMMAFLQYAMQIVFAFLMLSMMFIMLPRAAVSADRIAEVLDTEPAIDDPERPSHLAPDYLPAVEFRNVSFRYPAGEEDALHGISFRAEPGTTTAFIGATGSGKSTIVNLIPRFYDVCEGSVFVGGIDVRSLTQHELRDQIGYVPQHATLFSGTIASNLRYGSEAAPQEEIAAAISVAQADDLVAERSQGLDAEISQGGTNVSGGQKQRLSIARALVKRPAVYLFDDSFSALDYRTDANLRRALKERTAMSTVLIVSQRVATTRNADQILVLDDGRIVGRGTHHELMSSCDTYREIALSQLTEEELA